MRRVLLAEYNQSNPRDPVAAQLLLTFKAEKTPVPHAVALADLTNQALVAAQAAKGVAIVLEYMGFSAAMANVVFLGICRVGWVNARNAQAIAKVVLASLGVTEPLTASDRWKTMVDPAAFRAACRLALLQRLDIDPSALVDGRVPLGATAGLPSVATVCRTFVSREAARRAIPWTVDQMRADGMSAHVASRFDAAWAALVGAPGSPDGVIMHDHGLSFPYAFLVSFYSNQGFVTKCEAIPDTVTAMRNFLDVAASRLTTGTGTVEGYALLAFTTPGTAARKALRNTDWDMLQSAAATVDMGARERTSKACVVWLWVWRGTAVPPLVFCGPYDPDGYSGSMPPLYPAPTADCLRMPFQLMRFMHAHTLQVDQLLPGTTSRRDATEALRAIRPDVEETGAPVVVPARLLDTWAAAARAEEARAKAARAAARARNRAEAPIAVSDSSQSEPEFEASAASGSSGSSDAPTVASMPSPTAPPSGAAPKQGRHRPASVPSPRRKRDRCRRTPATDVDSLSSGEDCGAASSPKSAPAAARGRTNKRRICQEDDDEEGGQEADIDEAPLV